MPEDPTLVAESARGRDDHNLEGRGQKQSPSHVSLSLLTSFTLRYAGVLSRTSSRRNLRITDFQTGGIMGTLAKKSEI